MKQAEPMASSVSSLSPAGAPNVETDMTVQAFSQWLTDMKARSARNVNEMLSEMSIIRDSITQNNVDLAEFSRNSSGVSQQMQSQVTDLKEKLISAFGEITTLVKQKNTSDQEMMHEMSNLQGNLSVKTGEIENLKRSYSQAHQQLQSSLIQITNHLAVTQTEVGNAASTCERVQKETSQKLGDITTNLRGLEDTLSVGNSENRNSMMQLQEEIARIRESIASVTAEHSDNKRATISVHNKLQSHVWSLEEGRKRQEAFIQAETQAIARAEALMQAGISVRPAAVLRPEAAVPSYASSPAAAYPTAAPSYVSSPATAFPTVAAATTPPQSLSAVPAITAAMTATEPNVPLMQQFSQPLQIDTVTVRGVGLPLYLDHHLSAMPAVRLREHAQLLVSALGFEAAGAVPGNDADLVDWIIRLHRIHLEPLRGSGVARTPPTLAAGSSLSVVPQQQYVVATPVTTTNALAPTVVTPGMAARPPVVMQRQPLVTTITSPTVTSPQPLPVR